MKSWNLVPGSPAAGHVTAGGWWHPGPITGCVKCEPRWTPVETCPRCGRDNTAGKRHTVRAQAGSGWCDEVTR